jgi:hypothetical protein
MKSLWPSNYGASSAFKRSSKIANTSLSRPLKAVAAVRIRSGLHIYPPVSGGAPSGAPAQSSGPQRRHTTGTHHKRVPQRPSGRPAHLAGPVRGARKDQESSRIDSASTGPETIIRAPTATGPSGWHPHSAADTALHDVADLKNDAGPAFGSWHGGLEIVTPLREAQPRRCC